MRRSFRAATVFTGVAAIAGGFGPTALAAPATPTNQECGANNGGVSEWVHIYYPNNDHPAECFHGTGHAAVNATIYSYCAGNRQGYFFGHSPGGADWSFHFSPGEGRHAIFGRGINYDMTGISISGSAGTATCT